MTRVVDISEAERHLKELVSFAAEGNDVVIADNARPVAKLVAIPLPGRARVPNLNAGSVWMSPDFDDPLPDSFWLGSG